MIMQAKCIHPKQSVIFIEKSELRWAGFKPVTSRILDVHVHIHVLLCIHVPVFILRVLLDWFTGTLNPALDLLAGGLNITAGLELSVARGLNIELSSEPVAGGLNITELSSEPVAGGLNITACNELSSEPEAGGLNITACNELSSEPEAGGLNITAGPELSSVPVVSYEGRD